MVMQIEIDEDDKVRVEWDEWTSVLAVEPKRRSMTVDMKHTATLLVSRNGEPLVELTRDSV